MSKIEQGSVNHGTPPVRQNALACIAVDSGDSNSLARAEQALSTFHESEATMSARLLPDVLSYMNHARFAIPILNSSPWPEVPKPTFVRSHSLKLWARPNSPDGRCGLRAGFLPIGDPFRETAKQPKHWALKTSPHGPMETVPLKNTSYRHADVYTERQRHM